MTPPGSLRLDGITQVLRDADLLIEVRASGDAAVSGVSHDSRRVAEGDLFVAWAGGTSDGHDFAAAAVARGASALVVERPLAGLDVPQLIVRDGRVAASLAGHWAADRPGDELTLIAVTGTNGKTTTALLTRHLLAAGRETASIGTVGVVGTDGVPDPATAALTTPGPVDFADALRDLADAGAEAVVFEASSHALDQRRFEGVSVDAAVFTNLSQDHLDYHGDMDAYRAAKLRLLEHLAPNAVAVVNVGDHAWSTVSGPRTLTFAVEPVTGVHADLVATDVRTDRSSTRFTLSFGGFRRDVRLPLLGGFNVENALAATGVALALGHPLDEVLEGLAAAPQLPGRLEVVVDGPVTVVIDFAHTPDALDRVLATLRPLVEGRLVVLFGAGGDRDAAKRPKMAEAVARWADFVVLTSDNPRTEDPERILDDVAAGLGEVETLRETDRRTAIALAIDVAQDGDLVLLAGKGHERTQTIGTQKLPFDEAAIAREAWAARGAA